MLDERVLTDASRDQQVRVKARACNAFLQEQFRGSALTYGEGDLNAVLGEAWAGVELRSASGWAIEYLVRWESPELRSGAGSADSANR